MKKQKKDDSFIKKPFYKEGNKALSAFIYENLKYPKEAYVNNIEGTVRLKVSINHKGKVMGSKVTSGVGYGCDHEAQRVIEMLKFEVPKNPKKIKITFFKNMKIQFKMKAVKLDTAPKEEIKNDIIKYQYLPNIKSTAKTPKAKSKVITYTLKY